MNLKPNDIIPLVLQLFDNATNKFVRAVVRDSDDAAISGSPFSLAHEADGLYTNKTAVMPNKAFVSVQYLIYDDAGFTTLSSTHSSVAIEIPLQSDIAALSNSITGIVFDESIINGYVESNTLVGTVEECI